ncbi:hypothetical protein ACOMHN_039362 [Nucella lapillus]
MDTESICCRDLVPGNRTEDIPDHASQGSLNGHFCTVQGRLNDTTKVTGKVKAGFVHFLSKVSALCSQSLRELLSQVCLSSAIVLRLSPNS